MTHRLLMTTILTLTLVFIAGGCGRTVTDATHADTITADSGPDMSPNVLCAYHHGGFEPSALWIYQGAGEPLCTSKPGFIYNPEGEYMPTLNCQFGGCGAKS